MAAAFSTASTPPRNRPIACASATAESFAARFAAKEAGAKALGTGISHGVSWLEIEVVREPSGRPTLQFHGRAAQIAARLGVARAALSITHTADLAMASVVLEDYFSTSTPRQKATYPLILRAAGLGSG
jgi:phosphopantetheine--protein transferase-like protein